MPVVNLLRAMGRNIHKNNYVKTVGRIDVPKPVDGMETKLIPEPISPPVPGPWTNCPIN